MPATALVESISHRRFGYLFTLTNGANQTLFSVATQTELKYSSAHSLLLRCR